MGLAEQKLAGAVLERVVTSFTTDVVGSGSVNFGASYVILSIETDQPCRIRFYENTESRDDVGEINRTFGDTNISSSVALVGDFSMSAAGRYTTDPALYGVTHDNSLTYYRISPEIEALIRVTKFTIEDSSILPGSSLQYTVNNRRNIPDIAHDLTSGSFVTGTLDGGTVPRTFLMVSASLTDGTGQTGRLRFYSKSGSLDNLDEINRPFSTEPSASAYLIADMILSENNTIYFTPKIIGANLKTIGNNLQDAVGSRALIDSESEIYYVLQEISGSAQSVTASVHVFALED